MRADDPIFPLRKLVGCLAGIGLVFLAMALTYWQLGQRAAVRAQVGIATTRNVERMRYYDEALTMSARLNPFSADRSYERRYLRLAPQLERVIRDTLRLAGDQQAAADIALTGDANRRLVAMEMRAFALVREGEPRRASALLTSRAYKTQKRGYALGFKRASNRLTYITAKMSKNAALYVDVMLGVGFTLLLFAILAISRYLVRAGRRWSAGRKSAYEHALAHGVLVAQNEQLLELDQFKDELVATVSHELRTPLTSITGYLELVFDGETPLTVEQSKFLSVVDRGAKRLSAIISDLLFVAQAQAGPMILERKPIDVAALVEESFTAALPRATEGSVELNLGRCDDCQVVGDRKSLSQVVDNLLSNALKFTQVGGLVEMCVFAQDNSVAIEVSDTGTGISPADQKELFNRFFRTEAAMKGAIQGTGLGLSIVKTIVERHGGEITVESSEGKGSRFRVILPRTVNIANAPLGVAA